MVLPRKIAVVLHRDDSGFESARYLVKLLMARWQEMGVAPTYRGPAPTEFVLEVARELADGVGSLAYA